MSKAAMVVPKDNTPIFDMVILTVKGVTENRLRKALKEMDNTFGPMGSSGYSVRERDDGSFLMTELDRAPAESGIFKIKRNQIWAPQYFFTAITNQLAKERMAANWRCQSFRSVKAIQEAFQRA